MDNTNKWTGRDVWHLAVMIFITVSFALRRGPFPDAEITTIRYLAAYILYGFITVFIFLGLGKKMLKLNPSRKQIIKWAFGLAAFFSVNQMIYEFFLAFTGQHVP